MLHSVLPFLGAVFLVVALVLILLLTVIVLGSFAYACVMSCVVAIRQLMHRPAATRS